MDYCFLWLTPCLRVERIIGLPDFLKRRQRLFHLLPGAYGYPQAMAQKGVGKMPDEDIPAEQPVVDPPAVTVRRSGENDSSPGRG